MVHDALHLLKLQLILALWSLPLIVIVGVLLAKHGDKIGEWLDKKFNKE